MSTPRFACQRPGVFCCRGIPTPVALVPRRPSRHTRILAHPYCYVTTNQGRRPSVLGLPRRLVRPRPSVRPFPAQKQVARWGVRRLYGRLLAGHEAAEAPPQERSAWGLGRPTPGLTGDRVATLRQIEQEGFRDCRRNPFRDPPDVGHGMATVVVEAAAQHPPG